MPSMREITRIDSDSATWQTKGIWRHSSCVCADVRALIGVLNRGKVSPKIPDSLGNAKPVVEIFKNSSPKQVLDSMLFLYFNSFFNFIIFTGLSAHFRRTNWRIKSRKSLTKNPRLPRKCQACGRDFQEFKSKTGIRFNVVSLFQLVFQLYHFHRTFCSLSSH